MPHCRDGRGTHEIQLVCSRQVLCTGAAGSLHAPRGCRAARSSSRQCPVHQVRLTRSFPQRRQVSYRGGTSGESALRRVDPGRASRSPLLGSRLCCVPVPYRPCPFRRPPLGNHQGLCLRMPGAGSCVVFAGLQVFAVQGAISERTRMRSAGGLDSRMSRAGYGAQAHHPSRPGRECGRLRAVVRHPRVRCLKQTAHANHWPQGVGGAMRPKDVAPGADSIRVPHPTEF
jgi:hypothetical protein